jgi:Protein of unknown function (DUF3606)
MRHAKPQPIRNKIDLADPSQIRILRRRLGISADDLQRVVAKVGNSIAAVCKEIEPQKAPPVTEPMSVQIESPPPSEVGVAVTAA